MKECPKCKSFLKPDECTKCEECGGNLVKVNPNDVMGINSTSYWDEKVGTGK